MKILILFLILATAACGADLNKVLTAIAAVEGNDPRAIGRAGERSRYQMCHRVWRAYTSAPFRRASTDERLAHEVAMTHLRVLRAVLIRQRIKATERNLALAWTNGPYGMRRASAKKLDYANRAATIASTLR